MNKPNTSNYWSWVFMTGMLAGALAGVSASNLTPPNIDSSWLTIIAAGLLVGAGTKIGSGCTSGHGICGIGRFSTRSIVATITFLVSGIVSLYITK
jgi:uncharacterized membrane protein YedE/YeeE